MEKKVYLCHDCGKAYDGEEYGEWKEVYMSDLDVWVCNNCLLPERIAALNSAWAAHRKDRNDRAAGERWKNLMEPLAAQVWYDSDEQVFKLGTWGAQMYNEMLHKRKR